MLSSPPDLDLSLGQRGFLGTANCMAGHPFVVWVECYLDQEPSSGWGRACHGIVSTWPAGHSATSHCCADVPVEVTLSAEDDIQTVAALERLRWLGMEAAAEAVRDIDFAQPKVFAARSAVLSDFDLSVRRIAACSLHTHCAKYGLTLVDLSYDHHDRWWWPGLGRRRQSRGWLGHEIRPQAPSVALDVSFCAISDASLLDGTERSSFRGYVGDSSLRSASAWARGAVVDLKLTRREALRGRLAHMFYVSAPEGSWPEPPEPVAGAG